MAKTTLTIFCAKFPFLSYLFTIALTFWTTFLLIRNFAESLNVQVET